MTINEFPGINECFKTHKIVYLITFNKKEEAHSRPMTNFNEDPSKIFWFPTFRDTQKVKDIKENPKVLVLFPCEDHGYFYEIEGKASFGTSSEVLQKWEWWYLFWHPMQRDKFWISRTGEHPNRVIINVEPVTTRVINKDKIEYLDVSYRTVILKE